MDREAKPFTARAIPQLLTAAEVALVLKVSLRTVRRLIAERALPVVRIGRSVRIRHDAVAAMTRDDRE